MSVCKETERIFGLMKPYSAGTALVIENEYQPSSISVERQLSNAAYEVLFANGGSKGVELFNTHSINLVFIGASFSDSDRNKLIREIKALSGEHYVPIVILAPDKEDASLINGMSSGADDYLLTPFTAAEFDMRLKAVEHARELKHLYKSSMHEQIVGKKILTAALSARSLGLEDIDVMSRSAAVFSGDLLLTARHPSGNLHVLMADFTGHGLSAAIGVLPVADVFSVMSEKGFSLQDIIEQINSKLHTLLPTGMFMAVTLLDLDYSLATLNVWNGGMPDVYVLNGRTGCIRHRIASSHLPLGISESIDTEYEITPISIETGDQIVMATDGLTDAINVRGEMYGIDKLEALINRTASVDKIFSSIVSSFNLFCGNQPHIDDVTLVSIPCSRELMQHVNEGHIKDIDVASYCDDQWQCSIELTGNSLRDIDPVSVLLSGISRKLSHSGCSHRLRKVLDELFGNALVHGVSAQQDAIDIRDKPENCYVRVDLQKIRHDGEQAILITLEDSGDGFDYEAILNTQPESTVDGCSGSGLSLVRQLCSSLTYHGSGNRVEAIMSSGTGNHL